MKKIFFMILAVVCTSYSYGQNETDALRYSLLDITGTARFQGMGGAFGALGADMTTMSYNPAGIALYRRSEFGFSMGLGNTITDTEYSGTGVRTSNANFGINSLGMIGSYPTETNKLPRLNFGVGYNKLANFNESIVVLGEVDNTTLLDVFTAQAQGVPEDDLTDAFPFSAGLAYQTFLINPSDTLGQNTYDNEIPFGPVTQSKSINRSGSMGETVLSGGVNVDNKYYFGLTLGFPNIRFEERTTYREGGLDESFELDYYDFTDDVVTNGSGFNIKAGAIVRVADWIRLGAAIHSPTWLNMNQFYERSITSYFKGEAPYNWDSPQGEYYYRITTPARYMLNAAVIAGKIGVLGVDYEYIDYTTAKLRTSNRIFDDYDFASENEAIYSAFRGAHNVRLGAEVRISSPFRLRAGVAYQQNPYRNDVVSNTDPIMTYSGGLGFRKNNFYAEASYSVTGGSEDYYLYNPELVEAATISSDRGQAVLSVGFRY